MHAEPHDPARPGGEHDGRASPPADTGLSRVNAGLDVDADLLAARNPRTWRAIYLQDVRTRPIPVAPTRAVEDDPRETGHDPRVTGRSCTG